MTMFANCREKYTRDAYPAGTPFRSVSEISENEINPYWDGHLKGEDKELVRGYDWAVKDINACFNGITEALEEYLGIRAAVIDEKVVVDDDRLQDYDSQAIAHMNIETFIVKAMKEIVADYTECNRNGIVTGLIDAMPDDDEQEENEEVPADGAEA